MKFNSGKFEIFSNLKKLLSSIMFVEIKMLKIN